MNLNRIANINKDIDYSPIIITNTTETKTNRYNNQIKQSSKTNSKSEMTQANLDIEEKPHIVNPLITEHFGKLFATELESSLSHNKTETNEYSPKRAYQKDKLYYEAKTLCSELYKPKKQDKTFTDRRVKLYENIRNGMDIYLRDLQQNALSPKSMNNKMNHKKLFTSNDFKKVNLKTKSIDRKAFYIKNFVEHYYDEFKPVNLNTKNYTYQNYAIKFQIYRHNRMYPLSKNKLPPIEVGKNNKHSNVKDFSKLIPVRTNELKEAKKEVYCIYKIMKTNKKENFLI